jgi:hypothetical protein
VAAYATVDQFSDYLDGDALPVHPERLLDRATDAVNELLVGAVWVTSSTTGLPTDATVADKLREAVCIQADYMSRQDDELGTRTLYDSVSTGGVSYSRAAGPNGPVASRFAPALLTFIRTAGFSFGIYR